MAPLLFTDLMFWTLKAYLPTLFLRCLGMPKGFRPTPEQWTGILESEESLFPLAPRKHGLLFDQYVSNPDVQGYPLEQLSVPTLIVNARDDGLSAFENAASAAERIPGAELLAIDHGGHMLLGSEGLIVREVARFLTGGVASAKGPPLPVREGPPGCKSAIACCGQWTPGRQLGPGRPQPVTSSRSPRPAAADLKGLGRSAWR